MAKILKWILGICTGLLIAILVVACMYLRREWNRTTYFEQTTINGYDVSEKTPQDVLPQLTEAFSAAKVHLTENGREQAVWSLSDLGYTIDETSLGNALEDALGKQKSSIPVLIDSLMNGNSYEIDVPFLFDGTALASAVTAASMADPRVPNVNAELVYDAEAKNYSITPEVQGTELNDPDIQHLVQSAVEAAVGGSVPSGDISVQVPQELYIVPTILSSNSDLNMKMNTFNSYDKAVITHVYGDEKETIDWDTIQNWVVFEGGQGYLSEEKIREYVMAMGQKYNTIYYPRSFTTSYGNTIEFSESSNNYGYLVDEEGEYSQLLADIQSNTSVEREPVYAYTGVGRYGANDMATYVEVSLSGQHMWCYKDFSLVIESDIVSGCVAKNQETQAGIFPIAYKESPATLIPSNETNGTPVQYWMPFYDGQGLHDASWRSAFGGQIYLTSGSHGCVNLPPYVAEVIFNTVPTGTPVVLYK